MFHLDTTWFFFKRRLSFFCKFLKKPFSTPPWFLTHAEFCSKRSTFHRHYYLFWQFYEVVENLPIFLEKLQFFPNFSANLWPWIQCCFGLTSLTWWSWTTGVRQCFDTINFFRRHNFAVCLCHVFSGVSLHSGGDPVQIMIVLLGCPSARHFSWAFWIMVNCIATLVPNGSSHCG